MKRAKPYRRGEIWWIRWYRDGKKHCESTRGALLDGRVLSGRSEADAKKLLQLREGAVARGETVNVKAGRLTFTHAMADVVADYRMNNHRSLADVERRIRLHLEPSFGGRRMATITTTSVRGYVVARQAQGASNATCNRECAILKRGFTLALQAGTLTTRPHIPLLAENNARAGFFEPEQFEAVRRHLPEPLRSLVTFANITGWRAQSEVYRLQWGWVDFAAGEVRLPPAIAKNKEPRTFPMTEELRALLIAQRARVDIIQRERRRIVPTVFCWQDGRPIRDMRAAWRAACERAGCPGRLLHDFRRTAIRRMVRAGISEQIAMRLSGHKTRSVFDRYDVTSGADLRAAAAQLDAMGTKTGTISTERGLKSDGGSAK